MSQQEPTAALGLAIWHSDKLLSRSRDPRRLSSVVEQRFCKAKAIGSNPLAGFQLDPAPGNQFLPKGQRSINHQPWRRQPNCARGWRILNGCWLLAAGRERPATAFNRSWPLAATALNSSCQNRPNVKDCRFGIAADDSAQLLRQSHSHSHNQSLGYSQNLSYSQSLSYS
jgi:hypothetical protein